LGCHIPTKLPKIAPIKAAGVDFGAVKISNGLAKLNSSLTSSEFEINWALFTLASYSMVPDSWSSCPRWVAVETFSVKYDILVLTMKLAYSECGSMPARMLYVESETLS
jgi:hypothetical protein